MVRYENYAQIDPHIFSMCTIVEFHGAVISVFILYALFEAHFFVFQVAFEKILSICMASIQERIMIASVR